MIYDARGRAIIATEAEPATPPSATTTAQTASAVVLYGPSGEPAKVPFRIPDDQPTEIVRSFAFKMSMQNYGGNQYESADFFCSQKVTCRNADSEDASMAVYSFCRDQVLKSVKQQIESMQERKRRAA